MTKQVLSTYYRYEELPPEKQKAALESYGSSAYCNEIVQINIDEGVASLNAALGSVYFKARDWEIDPGNEVGSITVAPDDYIEEALSCRYGVDLDGHVHDIPDAESDGLFIGEDFKDDWAARKPALQALVDEINARIDDIEGDSDEVEGAIDELDRTLCGKLIEQYAEAVQECADRAVKEIVADGAYRYTEEALIEDCDANDYWFDEDGMFVGTV